MQRYLIHGLHRRRLAASRSSRGTTAHHGGGFTLLGVVAILFLVTAPCGAQTLDITGGTHTYASLVNTTVTLTNASELHITAAVNPIPSCTIHLNSEDSYFVMAGVKPSVLVSTYLSQVRISGAVAVVDSNCRVVQYANGAVVVPHAPSFQPLTLYEGPNFAGSTSSCSQYVRYTSGLLGPLNDQVSSFKLKRGYMATLATESDGSGASRNYIAADGDMEISVLPGEMDNNVSFVYVLPYRWVNKKGTCDKSPDEFKAGWHYNWNISLNSPRDWEYVAIKQQPYWPGLNQNWQSRQVNHVNGFNEPNNPVEDAYENLNPPGSVDDAVARWPELLGTGLRVGAPAVTDGGWGWITDFIAKAEAAGHRVDYVPIHYYLCTGGDASSQMYNWLKGIYDAVKRPLWVTEFNNGANWTGCADPSFAQNATAIESMITMMDNTPWIERYSVYSQVEEVRQTHYNAGGLTPMGVMYRDHQAPIAYLQGLQDNGTRSHSELRFDGNTLDSSGYGNNGITSGSPIYTNGHTGQAMVFDGAATKVTLPPNVAKGTEFSFAAWVYWKGGLNWQRIFDFGNSTTQYMFLTPKSGGNTLRFALRNGGSEQSVETAVLPLNQWKHVAVTLGGGSAKIYVDGVLQAENNGVSIKPLDFAPRVNFLGDSQFINDPLYNGYMDDVLISDDEFSPAQITAMQSNTPPHFTAASLSAVNATVGQGYSGATISGSATDPDAGDSLSYSKATGPGWLTIGASGALTGTPGDSDGGTNEFLVRVSDRAGASDFARLSIYVNDQTWMVARYAFEGNVQASVGTLHGTAAGAPGYASGHDGLAITLDGVNDVVTIPAGIADSDDLTISTWFKWDGGASSQRIFDFGDDTTHYLYLTPSSSSGTLRFAIRDGGVERMVEAAALPTGQWHHAAIVIQGPLGRLYVDGALAATSVVIYRPSSISPALNYIGRSQSGTDPLFDGQVDDFYVYNYALASDQISALYTNHAPVFAPDPTTLSNAIPSTPYAGSVAGLVTDADGDSLVFSKVGGPGWLDVAEDGTLTGTPGPADVGPNVFRIRATDTVPISDDLTVNISITPGADAIGIYGFENNVTSATGGNHGTAFGVPAYVPGVNGQAIDFDGLNDYVTLPAGMMNENDITVALRYRWEGGAIWQRLFDFGDNTTLYMFLTPSSFSSTLRFAITSSGGGSEQRIETPALSVGDWAHVAVVLEGDTGRLYVDGVEVDSGSITINPATITPLINYLGKSQYPDPLYNGQMDDLHIYNRALTAFEVANLANSGVDSDGDGFTDSAEGDADSDGDTIPDYLDTDSDNDGVPDSDETFADADGDFIPNIHDEDSDNDSMLDGWEVTYGLDPFDAGDAPGDLDGDGMLNADEHIAGTQPANPSSYLGQTVYGVAPDTVWVNGVDGRTYVLWRTDTPHGLWEAVATNGPVVVPGPLSLVDPAPPASGALYRTTVSHGNP